jgi:hypothetical protein
VLYAWEIDYKDDFLALSTYRDRYREQKDIHMIVPRYLALDRNAWKSSIHAQNLRLYVVYSVSLSFSFWFPHVYVGFHI